VVSSSQHDILIVGGGPVGAALALALGASGLSVLLADASGADLRADDPRTLALAYGSRLILERLGVWDEVTPATPIASIHVSHRGAFGRAALSAAEGGLRRSAMWFRRRTATSADRPATARREM
jgi:2-octaprenyl-6-methoxyphenol hydroxylase